MAYCIVTSSMALPQSGKWYCEFEFDAADAENDAHFCSVAGLIESNLFLQVGVLSSAANMPLPFSTIAFAISLKLFRFILSPLLFLFLSNFLKHFLIPIFFDIEWLSTFYPRKLN